MDVNDSLITVALNEQLSATSGFEKVNAIACRCWDCI
jgi:hypothetical protein